MAAAEREVQTHRVSLRHLEHRLLGATGVREGDILKFHAPLHPGRGQGTRLRQIWPSVQQEGEQAAPGDLPSQDLLHTAVQNQHLHAQGHYLDRRREVSAPPQLSTSLQGLLVAADFLLLRAKASHGLQPSYGLTHHLPCLRHYILDLL
ncbi:rCG60837 [Rattus norvegicus]|uniref:RCG60837 n=1 Tax=Rattus norvegicus TaxID=10116 RepID=A6JJE1_RAT|nr:rCG60837 [Rattus norvegicus]